MMPRALLVLLIGALLTSTAKAETEPRPGPADARVRSVAYHPGEVVAVEGRYGFLTLLELGEDETIENVALGDSLAWQATPAKDRLLFLKPIAEAAETNMVVVTSKRIYSFALSAKPAPRSRNARAEPAYRVMFRYPEAEAARAAEALARGAAKERKDRLAALREGRGAWNAKYRLGGKRAVRPAAILDDGRFTYLRFAANAEAPAIFAVEPDGEETLVNFTIEGGYAIVERVAPAWLLRAGKGEARLVNLAWSLDPPAAQP